MRIWTDIIDRAHLSQIVAIEEDTADSRAKWSEEDFLRELAGPNTTGRVAYGVEDSILGFIIYQVNTKRFHIIHLGVNPTTDAQTYLIVVQRLVGDLTTKVATGPRVAVTFGVRERNVVLQKALRSAGFKAFKVLRENFFDTDEDAFLFKFERSGENTEV